jgi:hypothetical protein
MRKYYEQRKQLPRTLASLEAFSASEKPNGNISNDSRAVLPDSDVRQEFFPYLVHEPFAGNSSQYFHSTLLLLFSNKRPAVAPLFVRQRLVSSNATPTADRRRFAEYPVCRRAGIFGLRVVGGAEVRSRLYLEGIVEVSSFLSLRVDIY